MSCIFTEFHQATYNSSVRCYFHFDWWVFIHLFVSFPASGQLVDFIKRVEQKAPLSCDTVLKILYQTCRAVQHMHKQKPPIIHRDLKVCCCLVDWMMYQRAAEWWCIMITNGYLNVYWLTRKSTAFLTQIENLLISNQGTIKLCDFGSATTVSHYPDYSWSAQKRSMVEDEVQTHTLKRQLRLIPTESSLYKTLVLKVSPFFPTVVK